MDPKTLEFLRSLRPGEERAGTLVQAGEGACLQKGLPQSCENLSDPSPDSDGSVTDGMTP